MRPKSYGSSTTGVKKSTVCTSASWSDTRQTAASSAVAEPTSSSGATDTGRSRTIASSAAAGSLHPHPAPCDSEVSGTVAASMRSMLPLDLWGAAPDADKANVGSFMERLQGIGRTAAHAAMLILDRAAAVNPWWVVAGTLLYLVAQSVRPLGWHTILRAAYPDATGLRRSDTVRAYLAGSGINSVVPARGGDVAKLAMVHRRIEGSRYPVLVATFVPETIFETAFGTGLGVWALPRVFLPVPTTSGELPSLDVSLVVGHPIRAVL